MDMRFSFTLVLVPAVSGLRYEELLDSAQVIDHH
jgi:hypothetical protein